MLASFVHSMHCDNLFQEFEDARDADDAVYDLNGKMLCGERFVFI